MGLTNGTRLGPYEIVSPLGAGGMGEVYRARDTRLDRSVAVKVLPTHLSANPELKQRFEREAKAISSLQHPHICTLHDVGSQDDIDFLVMEYLEGQTLADRLKKGNLPLQDALKIGTEIADALDKAHKQGIIHRDLKPGNIMLTKSGAKLLDFGLAKPMGAAVAAGAVIGPITPSTPTMNLASLTSVAASPITQKGSIVGTFQYIAPEVLQGAEADARSDLFSLGCVLYEMVTGRPAFEGKSQLSVLTAILEKEPEPVSTLQPTTPAAVDYVVCTCLAKNPEERWQSAADVARQLQWLSQAGSQVGPARVPANSRRRRLVGVTAAVTVLALLGVIGYLVLRSGAPKASLHAELGAPPGVTFDLVGDTSAPPALSPDGTQMVFGAHTEKEQQALWVRSLQTGAVRRLEGTEGGIFPFWSPDSRWIAFFSDSRLKKVPASGGAVVGIADAPNGPRGGAWLPSDVIVYSPAYNQPLFRVNPAGGTPQEVTKLAAHFTTERWPVALPDGEHFLYFATNHGNPSAKENGIYFTSLDGRVNKFVVTTDANAIYADGYLLYHQQSQLLAQEFDASKGTLRGDPIVVTDGIAYDTGTWHLVASASSSGALVYQRGAVVVGSQFAWTDRTGKTLSPLGQPAEHNGYSISPDGKTIAVVANVPGGSRYDIYLMDASTGRMNRLTFDPANHTRPSWSPDGKRVVYDVDQGGSYAGASIHSRVADGTGSDELLFDPGSPNGAQAGATWPRWSPDGRYLVFLYGTGPRGAEVQAIPAGGGKPFTVVKPQPPQMNIRYFAVSPDSRWIAYIAVESGTEQVYVSSFPSGRGRWQISSTAAMQVEWSPKSHDLFYLTYDFNLEDVSYNGAGPEFTITGVKPLFPLNAAPTDGQAFQVAPDGRFLVDIASQRSSVPLDLVLNWSSELKK